MSTGVVITSRGNNVKSVEIRPGQPGRSSGCIKKLRQCQKSGINLARGVSKTDYVDTLGLVYT
jgi:hypothetical protein